jgi:hypothetical protein
MASDKLQKVCGEKDEQTPDLDPSGVEKVQVREEGWLESRSTTAPNGCESSRESLLASTSLTLLARIRGTPAVKKVFWDCPRVLLRWGGAPRDSPLDRFDFPLTNGDSVCKPPNIVGPP